MDKSSGTNTVLENEDYIPIEIQLVKIKENHFLNSWNKITYYDTSRMLLIIFPLFIFFPWIIQFFIVVCILSYFISYQIFTNHIKRGTILLNRQFIQIEEIDKEKVILDMRDIERMVITCKFWKDRITNRNKQIAYNGIFIKTANQSYKFSFIFRNNQELYILQDSYEQLITYRQKFRFINLAHLNIDDLV